MIEQLVQWIAPVFADWGLLIVFAATFLETSAFLGLIVPGETVVILGGILSNKHFRSDLSTGNVKVTIVQVIVVSVIGVVAGDQTGYLLGRAGGRKLARRFKRLLNPKRLAEAEAYYRRHGGKTVFLGRFTPFLRSVGALVAGMSRMPYGRFSAWDTAGALVWGVSIPLVGYTFGRYGTSSIRVIDRWLKGPGLVFAGILIVVAVIYFRRRKAQKASAETPAGADGASEDRGGAGR